MEKGVVYLVSFEWRGDKLWRVRDVVGNRVRELLTAQRHQEVLHMFAVLHVVLI